MIAMAQDATTAFLRDNDYGYGDYYSSTYGTAASDIDDYLPGHSAAAATRPRRLRLRLLLSIGMFLLAYLVLFVGRSAGASDVDWTGSSTCTHRALFLASFVAICVSIHRQ